MWEVPEPRQKLDLTAFVVDLLVKKIEEENLLVDPKDIFKMAIIACEQAETGLPLG